MFELGNSVTSGWFVDSSYLFNGLFRTHTVILGEQADGLISANACVLVLDAAGLVTKDVRLNLAVAVRGG